jgi:hypothetical protein
MNAVELALAKQRLLLASNAQRVALARHGSGLTPLFDAADQVRAGARWIRQHPEVVAGGVAVVLAARPGARRFAWRWGRRAFLAWRLWRDSERWIETPVQTRSQ